MCVVSKRASNNVGMWIDCGSVLITKGLATSIRPSINYQSHLSLTCRADVARATLTTTQFDTSSGRLNFSMLSTATRVHCPANRSKGSRLANNLNELHCGRCYRWLAAPHRIVATYEVCLSTKHDFPVNFPMSGKTLSFVINRRTDSDDDKANLKFLPRRKVCLRISFIF